MRTTRQVLTTRKLHLSCDYSCWGNDFVSKHIRWASDRLGIGHETRTAQTEGGHEIDMTLHAMGVGLTCDGHEMDMRRT